MSEMSAWDDDPIVVTTGYYADEVDLWSCLTCGALVRGLFKDTHKAWHRYAVRAESTTAGGGRMSIEPQTHNPSREMDVAGNQFCDCGDYYPCPTVILLNLIAELREQRDIWLEPGMDPADDVVFRVVSSQVTALADRAEARLREVTGDE